MTNYEKGRAYEYRVKKKLEDEGWTVLRSAGSHGFADLVAIRQHPTTKWEGMGWPTKLDMLDEIKLIQCKTGKSSKRARKEVDISKWNGLYSVTTEVV